MANTSKSRSNEFAHSISSVISTASSNPSANPSSRRPKLDGLWIRLRYTDGETLEGVVPNDLLSLLDNGVQITPPDLSSNTDRIFVPRTAISSLTVLGVVGIARRKPAAPAPAQPKLFSE